MIMADDDNKDQTYFLYMLGQHALSHTLFPLYDLNKDEVRRLAEQARFPNHKKKDSTGICFIGERRFRDFLSNYLPANPGDIKTSEGQTIGQHQGLMYYTLGQRQGLGIGGVAGAADEPWFVIRKNLQHNTLIVAQGHDNPLLLASSLRADQIHWISGNPPHSAFDCQARCRHRQPLQDCHVRIDGKHVEVTFLQPQRAITAGQSIVFYQKDVCLGGGIVN